MRDCAAWMNAERKRGRGGGSGCAVPRVQLCAESQEDLGREISRGLVRRQGPGQRLYLWSSNQVGILPAWM